MIFDINDDFNVLVIMTKNITLCKVSKNKEIFIGWTNRDRFSKKISHENGLKSLLFTYYKLFHFVESPFN